MSAAQPPNPGEERGPKARIIITDADIEVPSESPSLPTSFNEPRTGLWEQQIGSLAWSLSAVVKHFVTTLVVIGLMTVTHRVVVRWLGDPRFFDLIPVRFIIDSGDFAVITTFIIIVIRQLWDMDRK